MIIAVDFDGTIVEDRFPEIGNEIPYVVDLLLKIQQKGHYIILWTCRVNDRLQEAVNWCKERGLIFDAVNDGIHENIQEYGTNPRKVYADLYIDDKNGFHNELVQVAFGIGPNQSGTDFQYYVEFRKELDNL